MMSYEQTLRLFTKYLEEEKDIIDIKKVTEKNNKKIYKLYKK
ncbi:hypothetical protein [Clostridium botulinum]|nr:hypothetical protein [Clostridium botulinum]